MSDPEMNCFGTQLTQEQRLYRAIKNKEGVNKVTKLVERGADISCLCGDYWTPLTLAANTGQADVLQYLLQCITEVKTDPAINTYGSPDTFFYQDINFK
jgi:hypothetical protein